jgi:hypothetical protein
MRRSPVVRLPLQKGFLDQDYELIGSVSAIALNHDPPNLDPKNLDPRQ